MWGYLELILSTVGGFHMSGRNIFIMTCQSVADGYIIMSARILAVKIELHHPQLIENDVTPTQCQTPPTKVGQSRGEDQAACCHLKPAC